MTPTEAPASTRPNTAAIANQNDAFRKLACLGISPNRSIPGSMHVTQAIMKAGDGFVTEAVAAVGAFEVFDLENDPDGCHDFGAVEIRGETVFWKIDLYETTSDFRYGAVTPGNPETTTRVLTVMLACDW